MIYNILTCVMLDARLNYLVHREYLMHIFFFGGCEQSGGWSHADNCIDIQWL